MQLKYWFDVISEEKILTLAKDLWDDEEDVYVLQNSFTMEINGLNCNKVLGVYNTDSSNQRIIYLSANEIAVNLWNNGFLCIRAVLYNWLISGE